MNYEVNTINIKFEKLFLLSDIHFGVRANSLEWLNNQMNFFDNFYIPFLKKNAKKNDAFFFFRRLF